MSQTLGKVLRGKDRAPHHEQTSSDQPCFVNRQAQIAADAELCLQLQTIEEQEAGALNSAASSASADIASGANTFDVPSTASAGTSSSAHATPLTWRVKTTGSKANRKVARQLVHNAARKIQSVARARLESLRAEEEARFQTELQQALRESVGTLSSASASSAAAEIAACANAPDYVHTVTASFTAAASAAAATPTATFPTGTASLAPTVTSTASSTTVAPSTGTASTTAAARTITAAPAPTAAVRALVTSTSAAIPAPTPPSTAPTQVASPALVRGPRQSQQLQLLPQGTYLPPTTMGVAIGPWGQHWNMVPHQPASHHKHGEPTHFNAQNEPVNAGGKPYTPPPPPGPRGCNGGSHRSWVKREKEKAKRQQKRAATGQ